MICLDSWTASFIVISVALEAGFFQRQADKRRAGWMAGGLGGRLASR